MRKDTLTVILKSSGQREVKHHRISFPLIFSIRYTGLMRLGFNLGYWSKDSGAETLRLVNIAENLGYSSVWLAEAYGSDAPTILSWIAAHTSRIDIGSAIMQIPARTPAMTAMTAATLDTLSEGRFRLGLGVSGPQVSEGWHGVRFAHPLQRTREYVEIVRQALSGDRVTYEGRHYTLPLPDGPGKPIKLTIKGPREKLPIYLASIGPKNLQLTGELCQGWLGILPTPESVSTSIATIKQGTDKVGRNISEIDIAPTIAAVAHDDISTAVDATRAYVALYVGGMGSKEQNFYNRHIRAMGYEEVADTVQDLYLKRDYMGAAAALPSSLLEELGLVGTAERMAEKLIALAQAGVTTCNIACMPGTNQEHTLTTVARAAEIAGL